MKRALMWSLFAVFLSIGAAQATVYEVSIVDFAYVPPTLTVAVGDSIHWTNNGQVPHTVTSGENCTPDGDFDSGTLMPGAGFGYFVDEEDAGLTIPYFCLFHCGMGMVGSYTVLDSTPAKENTWGKIKALYR